MKSANMTNKDIKILLFLSSKLSHALQLKNEKRILIDRDIIHYERRTKGKGGREIKEFKSA